MRYAGVLAALLESLGPDGQPGMVGRLAGKEIAIRRPAVSGVIALDSLGYVHLLLAPPPADARRFDGVRLKALKIQTKEWRVGDHGSATYLDMWCAAGPDSPLKRVFLSFCEDVLLELDETRESVEEAVLRTCVRWQRFWAVEHSGRFTREWVKGLLGELALLQRLVARYGPRAVLTWSGPDEQAHDFQGGGIALEVKTSERVPFLIQVNNLNQLDHTLFRRLYLVCFHLTGAPDGTVLPTLVRGIEDQLRKDDEMTDRFLEKLSCVGYQRTLEPEYGEAAYRVDEGRVFVVDEAFPRIIRTSFRQPPDSRVSGVRYLVELVGLEQLALRDPSVEASCQILCGDGSR